MDTKRVVRTSNEQFNRRFLSVADAAELLSVSEKTVRRLIADDAFTTRKIRGRRMILKASFDRWQSSLPD